MASISREHSIIVPEKPITEESKLEDSYRDIKKMMKIDSSSVKPPMQVYFVNSPKILI